MSISINVKICQFLSLLCSFGFISRKVRLLFTIMLFASIISTRHIRDLEIYWKECYLVFIKNLMFHAKPFLCLGNFLTFLKSRSLDMNLGAILSSYASSSIICNPLLNICWFISMNCLDVRWGMDYFGVFEFVY